jgi:branched-chain amino acid transport system ATP-binding protein
VAARPRLLLLDEPAAGLDTTETARLAQSLQRLLADGISILLVDHDMGLVLGICDRIHVLDYGRTIAEAVPERIRTNPAVISAYLGYDNHSVTEGSVA